MKLTWGSGIAVIYILFVVILVTTVAIFMKEDVHLVTDEYYTKELAYQQQIDKINRTSKLQQQLEINIDRENVNLLFPTIFKHSDLSGTIHFYRPSNLEKDFVVKVEPDSANKQIVTTSKMEKGLWKLKVDWNVNNISYYNEQILVVN
ncbi:MAG: FixH family protein [Bacteroidota bacterium]